MMTLELSPGTWSDVVTAAEAELMDHGQIPASQEDDRRRVEDALRAALRELNIEVTLSVVEGSISILCKHTPDGEIKL